jgi:site-specific DNA-methyltransferase (adenine-specific)
MKKIIGSCTLYRGDCFKVLAGLDIRADAVISDPPFGITDCGWDIALPFAQFWETVEPLAKPSANYVLFGCGKFAIDLVTSKYKWFRYDLIWQKNNKCGFLNANLQPMRIHEAILVFGQPGFCKKATYNPQKTPGGKPRKFDCERKVSGVYGACPIVTANLDGNQHPCSILPFSHDRGDNQKSDFHPTQKPLALMEFLVRSYTNEGDLVIDPFMGSGTTGVACAKLGRRFIGIEQETEYFHAAVKRIHEVEQ